MNVGRSIKVGLARTGGPDNHKELAKKLGISQAGSIQLARKETANGSRIAKLAGIFGVTVSEFISWGE